MDISGLCGVYDNSGSNDFATPDGQAATADAAWVTSWRLA